MARKVRLIKKSCIVAITDMDQITMRSFLMSKVKNLTEFLCTLCPQRKLLIDHFIGNKSETQVLGWIITELHPNTHRITDYVNELLAKFGNDAVSDADRLKLVKYCECFITISRI